ncbi:uncharacterized protein LOC142324492 isoform X2 [Lycorma delicatula]|uniref:uncharacterized protein LOC142324492 isoform X2 n=1 Tax=Lycorma delicatula TaxID=130591 RepID=UPI003F519345
MKFNGDGFITTNAVLLSIISFSIASAYPSILSKLKEERKAGSTAKEEQKSLGFKQRMHGFGLDHTNTTLGKARLRESVLGANGRRMPVFRSDIAQYDTNILFNDSKVSEARVTHLIPKIPNYASQYISQPDIAGCI